MDGSMLVPEFDHECSLTRKTLERVPMDRADWKPHEKSFSLGDLAGHIANIPRWTRITIAQDELDLDGPFEQPEHSSLEDLLAYFDEGVAEARESLAGASGEEMMKTWSLKQGGEVTLAMPKMAVLRGFVLSHAVHHRAQLGVYLRLLDVPVPSIYGPSADEAAF